MPKLNKSFIFVIAFCGLMSLAGTRSEIIYIKNFQNKKPVLPIKNSKDAINFFLQMEEVKKEISRKGQWWVKANLYDPVNYRDVWVVSLGDGNGECGSQHQCFVRLNSDGTINYPFSCSDGWNCK